VVIRAHGQTDVGRRRKNNEDSILVKRDLGLFVVSDGMGGHEGGEVASDIAVRVFSEVFTNRELGIDFPNDAEDELFGLEETERLLRGALIEANEAILNTSFINFDLQGMGCTVDAIVITDGYVRMGHVGDSRIYRLHKGKLSQVTRDHSVYNDLVHDHGMSPAEARENPYAKRVTNALGYLRRDKINIYQAPLVTKDVYLLCSDGLSDVVEESVIEKIVQESGFDPERCCQRLVDEANASGGPDNISVIILYIGDFDTVGL
jgi:protein phosphatase